MNLIVSNLNIWQALSLLGLARNGKPMSEERARKALRDIGMTKEEMNQPYPEEAMEELNHLLEHPEDIDDVVEEASEWMINRN